MTASCRKATILALIGSLWMAMGVVVAITQDPIDPARAIGYELLPIPARVALWMASGGIAVLALWMPLLRRIAAASLIVMVVEKVVGYAMSVLAFIVPGYPPGWGPALASMIAWIFIGGILYLAAGLPEDERPPVVTDAD